MSGNRPTYEELEIQVSKLQQKNKTLNKQLEFFNAFVDYSCDFEVLMLPTYNYLYVSPSCKMLTGYSANEFLKNTVLLEQIVYHEDKEIFSDNLKKMQNLENDFIIEFRIISKEGNIKWVEQYCGKAYNKSGIFIGYRASYRDVSKRKKAENKLNLTNKLLTEERQLFTHGNIAIFKWKNQENWPVEYASANIINILGYTLDEIKSSQYQYSTRIHPEDLKRVTEEVILNSNPENDNFQHSPYRLICKNGKIIWVSDYTIILRNNEGEIINYLGYIADITKLIEAEQALKESKAQIAAILNAMPDMIFIQNKNGVFIDYHTSQPEKLYTSPEIFIGKNVSDILPQNVVQSFKATLEIAIQTKNVQTFEYYLQIPSGKEYFECRLIAYENDKILSIIRNITIRKQIEIALKESEERYKRIADCLTDYLYTVRIKNGITIETIHNEACLAITGYSPQEFLSDTYLWINMVVPEEREMVRDRFYKILEGKDLLPIEHQIICKNGEIRWVSDTAIPKYDSAGELVSYDGIITDITERKLVELALKESEEKFRMMVMNNPDLTIFQDQFDKTIYINQQAMKVVGHESKTFLSATFPEYIHPDDKANVYNMLQEVKTGKSIENYEYRFYSKKGEINYLSHNAKPVIVNNNFLGIVSSIRNITGQKKFEEALKESELWYKSLNEAKDKFFSIIAHDLTGPFSSVLGLLDLLQNNIKTYSLNKIEKFVTNIYLSTKNAFLLLQSLLLWAKSQRGLLPFKLEQIDLKQLFNNNITFFKESANQKNIEIFYNLPENFEISADLNMIKMVLQNLISNAIKFTNHGGRIDLTAIETANNIEITVTDNGIGMDAEIQNKLFKLDSDLTTTGTADEQGTGLGLILCKEFVEKHNGKIWVKSQPDLGSEFKFTLPKKGSL